MKKILLILPAAALLAGACSKKSGGGVKLRNDTDSVAYVIGMNVGMNLLRMDSTINVNAVCEGIRDAVNRSAKLSAADAETFYLRYVNYALPEKARAYEEQFLADIAKSNRSYARTSSGVTYTVTAVGDQEQVPVSDRDSVALRWVIRTADGSRLREGRHGALAAARPAEGRAGEREADRQGREDQRLDAFVGGLRRRGRQGAGRGPQCDALL